MAGHVQLKFVMTECSTTQIRRKLSTPRFCHSVSEMVFITAKFQSDIVVFDISPFHEIP